MNKNPATAKSGLLTSDFVTIVAPPVMERFDYSINTLRALAVSIVVLFHFHIPGFEFGFIGVDIFFVISGYLMTKIIVTALDKEEFLLWRFYKARFTRIYPALSVLCIAVIVGGYFFITPFDYQKMGQQVAYTSIFISNFLFWSQDSYFNTGSEYKFLLHTWSLSVEWQFYILYPVILLTVEKLTFLRSFRTRILWLGLFASLALCLFISNWKPSASFFLLPTRGWEMILGGLLFIHQGALVRMRRFSVFLFGTGLILLMLMVPFHSGNWPNAYALLPTVGTALIIAAGYKRLAIGRFSLVYYLGLWSYSIYLWHWPVTIVLRLAERLSEPLWVTFGLVLSVILGCLSYYFVEVPFQNFYRSRPVAWRRGAAILLFGVPIMAGLAVTTARGLPERVSEQVVIADGAARELNPMRDNCLSDKTDGRVLSDCVLGDGPVRLILIGDSHADAVASAAAEALREVGSVRVLGLSGCPTMIGVGTFKSMECGNFNQLAFKKILSEDKSIPLLIVNRASYGPNDLTNDLLREDTKKYSASVEPRLDFGSPIENGKATFACAVRKDRKVFALRPIPLPGSYLPRHVAYGILWSGKAPKIEFSKAAYDTKFARANELFDKMQEKCDITPIATFPSFCGPGPAECQAAPNGHPLFYDDNHVNEFGNKRLVPALRAAITGAGQP
ncbi:acyltransferase family protein [Agrobacterium larrymoorei]|uniref:acyltransferase family protein n=1 Tax=Agrobacterium larrymoorei TaxID=160699 RepID=UPI0030C50CF0